MDRGQSSLRPRRSPGVAQGGRSQAPGAGTRLRSWEEATPDVTPIMALPSDSGPTGSARPPGCLCAPDARYPTPQGLGRVRPRPGGCCHPLGSLHGRGARALCLHLRHVRLGPNVPSWKGHRRHRMKAAVLPGHFSYHPLPKAVAFTATGGQGFGT